MASLDTNVRNIYGCIWSLRIFCRSKEIYVAVQLGERRPKIGLRITVRGKIKATKHEEILELLAIQFMPKVNVVAERFKFRKREKLPEESVDNYIAALRELASIKMLLLWTGGHFAKNPSWLAKARLQFSGRSPLKWQNMSLCRFEISE